MANDEPARFALHDRLRDVLGPEEATTLMAALPPPGGDAPATRADLRVSAADLRSEMAALGGELRSEMAALGSELRSEMAELRGDMAELRGDMAILGGELRSEMAAQTRTLVFAMVGTNATLVALAFAAARLA